MLGAIIVSKQKSRGKGISIIVQNADLTAVLLAPTEITNSIHS